jgi:hypothetical protein
MHFGVTREKALRRARERISNSANVPLR